MTQLIYNGKDITDLVDIRECILHDCAGGGADDATISFPDPDKKWNKWNPVKGDTVLVNSGNYSTGIMYVDRIEQQSGVFTISSISTPLSAKCPKTRIWRNIKLSEIITDIATNNSLKTETYNIEDFTYKVISQINRSDIDFLNAVCIREGYSCKVTDNKIVVFNERCFESANTTITLTPEYVNPGYEFSISDSLFRSFKVLYSLPFGDTLSYTATDIDIQGAVGRKVELLSNLAEAKRWSEGYLRYTNKYCINAYVPLEQKTDIAAGSTVNISDFGSFDGKYYVYRVTQDTVNNKTYLYLRQTITKY